MADPLDQLMITIHNRALRPALRGDRCSVCRQDCCDEVSCDWCGSLVHYECYRRAIAPVTEHAVLDALNTQDALSGGLSDEDAARHFYFCHACRS
jgi:hypothetical protein